MTYEAYLGWMARNRPFDMPEHEFLEFCALCGALTIQNTVDNEGLTVTELINRFFDKEVKYQ